ncbi:36826_t:CDS:2 [Gigaspora margarita]|uniref:36826_t:CDS:1 n=1 Tax=Gigaspora margarita TaxID=4874 RepID=A0ABM8W713_GIGMA|nr:36826_t:CDS:2 [Gigaspora margarita]
MTQIFQTTISLAKPNMFDVTELETATLDDRKEYLTWSIQQRLDKFTTSKYKADEEYSFLDKISSEETEINKGFGYEAVASGLLEGKEGAKRLTGQEVKKYVNDYMANHLSETEEKFYNEADRENIQHYETKYQLKTDNVTVKKMFNNNNYLLPEYMVGNGVDTTSFLINEIKRLKRIITQHQEKEQEYERELNKILEDGVSKEELLVCVEEVFGKSNFKNGKYQGGKELIITTIEELFDNQNLKQSLENGEAKTLTSNLIEQKLGGSEKFQDGIYQPKPEIVKSVLAEMKPQGAVLKEIHNIFGSGEFYPMEGGEGVPPGREGCRKNAEEIAMMQAQEQKKIRAIEE